MGRSIDRALGAAGPSAGELTFPTPRNRGGRPRIPAEIRRLIREMSLANRLWGATSSANTVESLSDATG
jgi:hypothetical protein